MKFDFESLSTEPLFYMLMHSGAFVCVLGFIFFVVGLLFGYATWGRFKRQTRQLLGEASSMKIEIANLKRKVGDHSILSGPAVAMATETIHMPKKEKEVSIVAETVPAVSAETITTHDIPPPTKAPQADALPLEPTAVEDIQPPESEIAIPAEPPAKPATASIPLSASELPPPAPQSSSLAAIISAPHVNVESEPGMDAPASLGGLILADTLPALTELLLPALPEQGSQPPLELKPEPKLNSELDPKLGFVYKTRPEKTDDLTTLEGISHVLEKRLHDIGIYTYEQIAAWDEDHVKEFSARLAFKDRIKRERWVEQAREIAIKQTIV
jgi:hypothetical protein